MNVFLTKNTKRKILVSLTILILFSVSGYMAKAIIIDNGPFETNVGSTDATIIWTTNGNPDSPANSDSRVYYTASNGLEWIAQNNPSSQSIYNMDFATNDDGWAVGRYGLIIHTTNGGETWTEQSGIVSNSIVRVRAIDANNAWALSPRELIRTTNSGSSWSVVKSTSTIIYEDFYIEGNNIYIVTYDGAFMHSDDNGSNWTSTNISSSSLNSIEGIGNIIWCVGNQGSIHYSSDGGNTWEDQNSVNAYHLYENVVLDENNAWAVGELGLIIHTSDGGQNWYQQNSNTALSLFGIDITPTHSLYATGYQGATVYSNNLGTSWSVIEDPISSSFSSVKAIRDNRAYFGGSDLYYYGLDYDSALYSSELTDTHIMNLTGLSPLTTYYYYVCSENTAGDEVCSNNYSFTTLAACSDGTANGACNDLHQYCEGTTLIPADGPNCDPDRCNFDCSTLPDTPYCDMVAQTCVDRCIDGTERGLCNASLQYCDPLTTTLSDDCNTNEIQCGYICPSDFPECHTDGICHDWCSDNTPFGQCSALTDQYCNAGTLTPTDGNPNCAYDCFNCATTPSTPYCDETGTEKCIAACSDGTLPNACNLSNQYCDSSLNLINDCSRCGLDCPVDQPYCDDSGEVGICRPGCDINTAVGECNGTQYCESTNNFVYNCTLCGYTCPANTIYCDTASGVCQPGCDINTAIGECSGTQYCESANNFVYDCSTPQCNYICPDSEPYCNTDGNCVAACSDGTTKGNCSGDYLCNADLDLVHYCGSCGYTCPADAPYCDESNGQCLNDRCSDGTLPETCNLATGQYCQSDLTLEDNCNCGHICPTDTPYCDNNGTCQPWCEDETPRETCNLTTFEYCDSSLNLLDDCGTKIDQCGYVCPSDFPYCNRTTGECIVACSDGTPEGSCSGDLYCNSSLELVNDCRQTSCGYTCLDPTPQCNQETGLCEADNTAPIISNINIDADVYSAVLTFDTNELAWSTVVVETNPNCSFENSIGSVKTIANFDLFINHQIDITELSSSTTFYLCIYVYDAYDNYSFTGEPSTISFTTLEEPDTTLPDVNIITPNEGNTVFSTQTIEVEATDNVEISYVEIFIDASTETIAHLTSPSSGNIYTSAFDTTLWDNGEHTLQAIARDTSGNERESTVVTFIINNDVSPPLIENISAEISVDENDRHIATITWTTNEPATSRVDYTLENTDGSFDTSYGGDTACTDSGHCVQASEYTTSHTIILNNLESNRRYHYQITSCDSQGNCSH